MDICLRCLLILRMRSVRDTTSSLIVKQSLKSRDMLVHQDSPLAPA